MELLNIVNIYLCMLPINGGASRSVICTFYFNSVQYKFCLQHSCIILEELCIISVYFVHHINATALISLEFRNFVSEIEFTIKNAIVALLAQSSLSYNRRAIFLITFKFNIIFNLIYYIYIYI